MSPRAGRAKIVPALGGSSAAAMATGQPGTVLLAESASGKPIYAVTYDPGKFEARAEEIPIQDSRLKGAWGDRVARIILKSKEQVTSGSHRVAIDYIEKNDR